MNPRSQFPSVPCRTWLLRSALLLPLVFAAPCFAQTPAGDVPQFAPGVLVTIPPSIDADDLVSTHDLVEIRAQTDLRWQPEFVASTQTLYEMAGDAKFRRTVWCLEFSFKPLRMMYVDVPSQTGQMQRKLIWYMVYRVKNVGQAMHTVQQAELTYAPAATESGPVRFIPRFVLESKDLSDAGAPVYRAYLDRVIPAALEPIRQRELPRQRLLNSAQMAVELLQPSPAREDQSLWGVATWEDVDPLIDFFVVYAGGLTNAYRWTDNPQEFAAGDPPGKGRRFAWKTLQLNFWRPGDQFDQTEREIRFGVPLGKAHLYDVEEGVAYRWTYR